MRLVLTSLCACALATLLAGCAATAPTAWRGAAGLQVEPQDPPGEDTTHVPLWPLLEWSEEADGSNQVSALLLFESVRDPDGNLRSLRVINYLQGPEHTVFFPLYYDVGPDGASDQGVVPLAFWGQGYSVWPLLLSGWWRSDDGNEQTWITPLYHQTVDEEGLLVDRHVLLWFERGDAWMLFPLAWSSGWSSRSNTSAVLPFWFSGPDWWFALPLLSGASDRPDGGRSLWITPLFHRTTWPDAPTAYHVGPWYQHDDDWLLFPLAWSFGEGQQRHFGALPFWASGPGYTTVPLLLSGVFDGAGDERSTWITPLFHYTGRDRGDDSFHLLTYFQGPDYKILFPLAYDVGPDGREHRGVIPLWFGGPSGWLAPLLLSAGWGDDAERNTWITPLFHHTAREHGEDSFHLLTYFQGPDYKILFPLGYSIGPEGDESRGILPLWFAGSDAWVIPPLLTARWRESSNELVTWVTPFFHHTSREVGDDSFHLLTYAQGPGYQVLFPLAWSFGNDDGGRNWGVLPLAFGSEKSWIAPLLLSAGWREGAESNLWITPLFHRTARDGETTSWHLFPYFHGRDYDVLFPLAWHVGSGDDAQRGLLPFYMDWRDGWFSPLLLSGQWRHGDGDATSLITPLFHRTRSANPQREGSWHLLNWFQGHNYRVLFPLYFGVGPQHDRYRGLVPLWFDGPDWGVLPPLLTAWWRGDDGGRSLWATPLYHHRYGPDGALRSRHLLNFVQTPELTTVFPLYWDWTNSIGDQQTLLAPLYWQRHAPNGDFMASVLPPLFNYREAAALDTSALYQAIPFSYQDAGDDWEFNLLWRLFHRRVQADVSRTVVGPLWWSESRPGMPLDYKLLGGLFARDVFESRGTYRNRWLWFLTGDEQPIESAGG